MHLFCIGVDYKSAALSVRETLYRQRAAIARFFMQRDVPYAIFSTCNRFEIYAAHGTPGTGMALRQDFCAQFGAFSGGYYHEGECAVFGHALRLVCGLKSQLIGESQIKEQIESWLAHDTLFEPLESMWRYAAIHAEAIRRLSGLTRENSDIVSLVYDDIAAHQGVVRRIAILGTGKLAELLAQRAPYGARLIFISRKHYQRAKMLALRFSGQAVSLSNAAGQLKRSDVLIGATTSPHVIVKQETLAGAVVARVKPFLVYDIAIPRVIAPQARIPGVTIKTMDDLQTLFTRHNEFIIRKIQRAESLITRVMQEYREGAYDTAIISGDSR